MNERKLTAKDVVFLSYCDSENNGKNFDDVIKPLASYLLENDVKIFCMRDPQTGNTVVPPGESYIEKEYESIRGKTSIFVAYITDGYLKSPECERECQIIKSIIKDTFDKPKFILIYNSNDVDELKQEILRKSWYSEALMGDGNVHLSAPKDFEKTKDKLLKEYYKKLKRSYNIVYKRSHLMSDMVLHSLKAKYACTTVSNYILQSNELTHKESGYELHIVTDEIENYDMTVLSSMAIALNLQKDVKYIYYGSAENKRSYDILKQVVRGFVCKNDESRRKVDRYIRYVFDAEKKLSTYIEQLDKRTYSEFLDTFPNKAEILENQKQYLFKQKAFKEVDNILAWLRGKRKYDYGQIKHFNDFLQSIVSGEENNQKHIAVVLNKIAADFKNLVTFSDWNVGNLELEPSEIVALEDDLEVSEEIRGWIGYHENEGESPLPDEYVDEILENMHYITISEKALANTAFSFCIFYEREKIASAWYRTAKGIANFQIRDDAKTEPENDIDNDLIMRTADDSDNEDYIYMFYYFIKSSSTIRKELNCIGSSLLPELEEYYQTHDKKDPRINE